jgi:hypothetical protein
MYTKNTYIFNSFECATTICLYFNEVWHDLLVFVAKYAYSVLTQYNTRQPESAFYLTNLTN